MLPLIGDIAPPSHRATAISLVSSGLLLGLLLARVLAGIVSQYTSWRNIYWLALGLQVFILVACWAFMPDYPATMTLTPTAGNAASVQTGVSTSSASGPATTCPAEAAEAGAVNRNSNGSSGDSENANSFTSRILLYPSILWSTITHFTQNPTLVQACLMGFFFSAPYTSFWTTLTFLLSSSPYNYSTLVIGLFAVVGILPMTLGPIYSRLILDHSTPHLSTLLGILFCMLGAAIGVLGKWNIAGPIVQCVLLDLGQQVALTSCRVSVYESAPGMRSRANTAFVLFLFGGNIMGTSVGSMVFVRFGWVGMEVVAVCFAGVAVAFGGLRGPHERGWIGWRGGWGWRRTVEEEENRRRVGLGLLVQRADGDGVGDDGGESGESGHEHKGKRDV